MCKHGTNDSTLALDSTTAATQPQKHLCTSPRNSENQRWFLPLKNKGWLTSWGEMMQGQIGISLRQVSGPQTTSSLVLVRSEMMGTQGLQVSVGQKR